MKVPRKYKENKNKEDLGLKLMEYQIEKLTKESE